MKHKNGIGFLALLLSIFSGCSFFSEEKKPDFVIVNVLDAEQYQDCHIKGSINVPFEDLEDYAESHFDKEKTTIVVHCSNYKCTASGAGAESLLNNGFKKVFAYEAGTAEALKEGVSMEGSCSQEYLKDFAKPKGYDQEHMHVAYPIISTQQLKKMMQEFAGK